MQGGMMPPPNSANTNQQIQDNSKASQWFVSYNYVYIRNFTYNYTLYKNAGFWLVNGIRPHLRHAL
jgi:hypothetical protein